MSTGFVAASSTALAQTDAAEAAQEPAAIDEGAGIASEPPIVPAQLPVESGAPAQSAEPAPETDPDLEAAPETEAEAESGPPTPVLRVGVGLRSGVAFGLRDGDVSLSDGLADQINIRPSFSGQLNEHIGFFTSLEIGTVNGLGVSILDAVLQVRIVDELQIWIGQHIPANDRNNINGPFFGNGWNFAIAVPSYPFDSGARDRGVTIWGLVLGGILKYHASVADLQPGQPIQNARYGGRVVVHLLQPENFYYNSGTYFGAQDVLAIGGAVQYQNGVSGAGDVDGDGAVDNDFIGYSFDAFFEKNLGPGGTLTFEAGFWDFSFTGADYVVNQGTTDLGTGIVGPAPGRAVLAMVSWLTPERLGVGYLQPSVRYQWGDYDAAGGPVHVVDVALGYIIDGFNHRWYLNYRHVSATADDDIVQVGAQVQM